MNNILYKTVDGHDYLTLNRLVTDILKTNKKKHYILQFEHEQTKYSEISTNGFKYLLSNYDDISVEFLQHDDKFLSNITNFEYMDDILELMLGFFGSNKILINQDSDINKIKSTINEMMRFKYFDKIRLFIIEDPSQEVQPKEYEYVYYITYNDQSDRITYEIFENDLQIVNKYTYETCLEEAQNNDR